MPELWAAQAAVNRKFRELEARSSDGVNRKLSELWARDSGGVNRKIFSAYDCQATNSIAGYGIAADGSLSSPSRAIADNKDWFHLHFDPAVTFDVITIQNFTNNCQGLSIYVFTGSGESGLIASADKIQTGSNFEVVFGMSSNPTCSDLYFQTYQPNWGTLYSPAGSLWIAGKQIKNVELI